MELNDSVKNLPFVGDSYLNKLAKLNVHSIEDLLNHIPHRYEDFRNVTSIRDAEPNENATIVAKLVSIKNIYTRTKKIMQVAEVQDSSGTMYLLWFYQPYLVKTLKDGVTLRASGKVSFWQRKKALISPSFEKEEDEHIHTGRLVPTYPETSGVSSKWIRRRVLQAYNATKDQIKEFLPLDELKEINLTSLNNAISWAHFPKNLNQARRARKRLAFNELLLIQMKGMARKRKWKDNKAHILEIDKELVKNFIDNLPFKLTSSQTKVIEEVKKDLQKDVPMNRLLQGDVGAGKTVIAAFAAFNAFANGYQTAIMAPTQILASQHFDTLNEILSKFKVRVSLITSSVIKKDIGRSDVIVGTHALLHKKAVFENVALVVIDEQHRFGVKQRAFLTKKANTPHVLTMTATPIPRTIALTLYGDLSLSSLKELPKGRIPITTWVVPPKKRVEAYNWTQKEIIQKKVQTFVICPLIEESEKESMQQVKAATNEYELLKKRFPKLKIGLLHGRIKAEEKSKVLTKFKNKKIDILVATPVVEVGIDIPNAAIIIIEAAERFGLAQLHQLRGRVGRSNKKSYCILFTESKSEKTVNRLKSLKKTLSGFELAELDLKIRGPGEVYGTSQHGFPYLKVANWHEDAEMIELARKVALKAIKNKKKFDKLYKKVEILETHPN